MKKLLVAAIGAAAAIGAFADPWYSGTSFESLSAGDLDLTQDEGLNWSTNGASTLAVKDIQTEWQSLVTPPTRVEYFRGASNAKALSIQTKFGEPAYRSSDTTKTMGEVYVDVLVKPTICDSDTSPTLDGGAKIAIWLQEVESPAATNLMITAGYLSGGSVVQTNYNCGTYGVTQGLTGGAEDWQRFTIKSFASVSGNQYPGFVVFRNGAILTCSENKCAGTELANLDPQPAVYHELGGLFPSLVQTGDDKTKISKIGFDGTGVVDDVLFTDVASDFAEPFKEITLAWDSHVRNFTYTVGVGGAPVAKTVSGSGSMTLALKEIPVDITISSDGYEDGWTNGLFTATGNITAPAKGGKTFNVPANVLADAVATIVSEENITYMTVNGKPYTSVAEAIDDVNDEAGSVAISLNAPITLNSAITLNGPNLTGVTLDLNGQSITYDGAGYAITASKPLTIIDSAMGGGGSITAPEVVTNTIGLLTISAGTFNGKVAIGGTAAITGGTFTGTVAAESATGFITGGTFSLDYTAAGYIASGYEASEAGENQYVVGITTYTIKYRDSDKTTKLYDDGSYQIGDAVTPVTPIKGGYEFAGWTWYIDEDDEWVELPAYVAGTTAGDLLLVASWTPAAVPTFTLTAAPGANMTVAVYTNDVVGVDGVNNDYTIASNDTAKIVYTAESGYKIEGQDTYTTNIVVEANVTVTAPTATASVTPIDPDKGGEQTYDSDAAATAAANAINNDKENLIAVDSSVIGEAKATYLSKVEAVADGTKVTIQFTAAAEPEVQAQADADNAALPLASIAAAAVSAEATVTATPGCYYTVESGTTPGGLTPGTPVLATGTTVTLTIPNKGEAGFYKIKVTPTK